MDDKWPTLTPKEYNKLERVGIKSCDEFIAAIKLFGLTSWEFGVYNFASPSEGTPSLRLAGKVTWQRYLTMLDSVGFDWKAHLVSRYYRKGPPTETELRIRIDEKIDELIELLKQYRAGPSV